MTEQQLLDAIWRKIIGYRSSVICKHFVAADILNLMEQAGYQIPISLARAVIFAEDDEALAQPICEKE